MLRHLKIFSLTAGGGLDAGDRARITVTLKNTGLTDMARVTARLTSITPGATVTTQEALSFQPVPVCASSVSSPSYTVSLERDGKLCGRNANFILSIKSHQGELVDSFGLLISNDGTSCVVNNARWVQPTSITTCPSAPAFFGLAAGRPPAANIRGNLPSMGVYCGNERHA